MKIATLLSVLTLLLSFQVKASDFDKLPMPLQASMILSAMPLLSINASVATTTGNFGKEARQVIVDGQDYLQTGEMTIFLAEKVKRIQSYEEMSDDEAIDVLFNVAESVLN